MLSTNVNEKNHGSRQTRLEAEFSASVGTPSSFKDQGADAKNKCVQSSSAHVEIGLGIFDDLECTSREYGNVTEAATIY